MEQVRDLNMEADDMQVVLSANQRSKQENKGSSTDTQAALWR